MRREFERRLERLEQKHNPALSKKPFLPEWLTARLAGEGFTLHANGARAPANRTSEGESSGTVRGS